jgi:CubicO group peptidase (beta-lactamase class C family)
MRRHNRTLVATALATALLVAARGDDAGRGPAEPAADQLRRDIAAYLEDAALNDVRAVLVVVGDRMLVEEYYGTTADEYRPVFSVTKSVLSALVGIAVGEGLLDVDDPLPELLPDHADEMTPEVAATTLEQLLTMTGGFVQTWTSGAGIRLFEQPAWVTTFLGNPDHPPGERFAYSDPGAHLVAAALAEATDRSVLDYARDALFDPLGVRSEPAAEPVLTTGNIDQYEAADFAWPVDPQGIHLGSAGLKLRPRDMAALGSLYLHGGRVDGEQVVPPDWVLESTSVHVRANGPATGYGYLWWVGELDDSAAYLAVGFGGQLVAVVPDRELVVVVSTHVGDHAAVDEDATTDLVDAVIAPAVQP